VHAVGSAPVQPASRCMPDLMRSGAVWQPNIAAALQALQAPLCRAVMLVMRDWEVSAYKWACELLQLAALADLQGTQQELRRQGVAAALLGCLQDAIAVLLAPPAAAPGDHVLGDYAPRRQVQYVLDILMDCCAWADEPRAAAAAARGRRVPWPSWSG
jgi:hypothetical protein